MSTSPLVFLAVTGLVAALAVYAAGQPTGDAPAAAPPANAAAPASRTTPSGLKIVETKRATDDQLGARNGDRVWVHYTGRLEDGKKFDSSLDRGQPIEFVLGTRQVIPGWEEGLQGMRIGDERQLTIPPELGYGSRGAGGVIPPNATLIFDVKLVGILRP